MKNTSPSNIPLVSLCIGVLFIGLSPILIKMANAPGVITSFYRFSIGSFILLIPFLISRKQATKPLPQKGVLYALLAGFCLAIDMVLWTTAIVASNATIPTLVGNLAPVWVGLGALVIFKEKQSLGFWLGLLLAICGVALLISKDFMQPTALFKGISLGVLAGIFYAAYQLSTQPGRAHLSTIDFLFLSSLTTAFFTAIFSIALGHSFTGYDTQTWILWLILGVFIQVGAWFLINYSQGFLAASVVSPTLLGQPIVTALIASIFLDEQLSMLHYLSGAIIILGIYIVYFSRKRKSKLS